MIAHSFKGELFGPARALHGCTYIVDAVRKGKELLPGANYLADKVKVTASQPALAAGKLSQ